MPSIATAVERRWVFGCYCLLTLICTDMWSLHAFCAHMIISVTSLSSFICFSFTHSSSSSSPFSFLLLFLPPLPSPPPHSQTVICPHKTSTGETTIQLPLHSTHLKITRPQLRVAEVGGERDKPQEVTNKSTPLKPVFKQQGLHAVVGRSSVVLIIPDWNLHLWVRCVCGCRTLICSKNTTLNFFSISATSLCFSSPSNQTLLASGLTSRTGSPWSGASPGGSLL